MELGDYDAFIKAMEQLADSTPPEHVDPDDELPFDDGEDEDYDLESEYLLGYEPSNPYKGEEGNGTTVQLGHHEGIMEDEVPDYITDADIVKYASVIYPEKKVLHSLVLEVFTPEQLLELERLRRNLTVSNNRKVKELKEMLTAWGKEYSTLGPGTNRLGILMDGYTVKIALDADGEIDNKREFMYSMQLYPYVIKCYECLPNGLCAVFEYVEVFSLDDYHKNQEQMRKILTDIAANFLIGDVGISSKNYLNWGYRNGEITILDFAYIYSVKFKTFTCQCSPDAILHYDKDFNNMICPVCGKKYSFKDIRKKISRRDQDLEIGDIREKGYVISSSYQEVDFNPNFTDGARDKIFKALMKMKKKRDKKLAEKSSKQNYDPEDGYEVEEIVKRIYNGDI